MSAEPAPRVQDLLDLRGSVALVTGGGRNLGAAIASRFAEAGAMVAVHYRTSSEGARNLAEALSALQPCAAFAADLTDPDQVTTLFAEVIATMGRLDILVNNAGTYPPAELLTMTSGEWDAVIDANLKSTFLCTQAAARQFVAQGGGGAIVNVASIEAIHPLPSHSHYGAAKAAVAMLTKNSALDLAPYRVRVNAISPGLIDRPGLQGEAPELMDRWRAAAVMGRPGQATEVADACLFLASPAARWITAVNLPVDGGATARSAF